MQIALATLLILNGVFNLLTWPAFYRRVVKDPRAKDAAGKATRFLIVHAVLVAVALVLGLVSIVAAILALGGAR